MPFPLILRIQRSYDSAAIRLLVFCFAWFAAAGIVHASDQPTAASISVADFLPAGYVTDGSVSYQSELQRALDEGRDIGRNIVFPPMKYLLDDPTGLQIQSGITLWLNGATFVLSPKFREDGQAFIGNGVSDVRFSGGTIIGQNSKWPTGTNIRGIYLTGPCRQIRIENMIIRDLSSNGIGIFGTDADQVARDVWLIDTTIDNCCNVYGDYQAEPGELHGPEKGSVREDQGSVAFYFVENFVVRGCRFETSRSDGTHFYRCRNGQFTDNRVFRAKMGGYFVETCDHILATNNVIRENGSRGVTIERGSRACTLIGNTVEGSGREGLWMPNCSDCIAMNNLFLRNGRKENGEGRHQTWDANVTINQARHDPNNSPTQNCVVSNNVFETGSDQIAAIRIDTSESVRGIFIQGNVLLGENQRILVEGEYPKRVRLAGNQSGDSNQ